MRGKKNTVVCLTLLLFASMVIYLASQFRELPPILQRGLQPSTFPILCSVLIMLLTIMIWLKGDKESDTSETSFNSMTIKVFLIIPVFVMLLSLDFFLAVALSALAIHMLWTDKLRVLPIFLLGIVLPIFIYVLFGQVLDVKFPAGIVTDYLLR